MAHCRAARRWARLVALAVAVTLSGCDQGQPRHKPGEQFDARDVPTRDDITAVHAFWIEPPWLLDMGNATGFRTRVYFISAKTGRGVFVSGEIKIRLYDRRLSESGDLVRTVLHEWELDQRDAMMFRVTSRTLMGYSYGFVLEFPKTLDVAGKNVDIVIAYERADGREIPSPPKAFKLPGRTRTVQPTE